MTDVEVDNKTLVDEAVSTALGVEEERLDQGWIIDKPFDPDKIKVTTERKTIDLIIRRIDHGEVDLAPEFQRRARVWHPRRKSQLIESLLLRIPLPVFYVAANHRDDWAVVDGLQRLTTIFDFMKNVFPLTGLEYLDALDGLTFGRLDRSMQRRIEETELVINVIQPGTPEEVMINIFKRINTGGAPLTGQEIRNALHKGPVREFLRGLADSAEFKSATDNRVRDERMDAQEMVLRFLAFRMTAWAEYRVNDLDAFLNDAMHQLNAMSQEGRDALGLEFRRAMRAATSIFEGDAFRKPRILGGSRNPVSKPLFEAWSVNLACLNDEEISLLVEQRQAVRDAFQSLVRDDPEFVISISYSTGVPRRVSKRFGEVARLVRQFVPE
ncbi:MULTISPECIES: DUF262 domain-containing protein [unclassified Bradyrhizobium]|uniref:DUF262 domain-containing protein n=1 Tax=unclassified Bradyrhizobium TaxID=2631580 RepID=UPI001CD38031|nr:MULTISPECIES: DUF262 domain-containing protein [unclassified Bradyrhizobium]